MLDWETAYENVAFIPGGAELPGHWAAAAAAFRMGHPPKLLSHGRHSRECTHVFAAGAAPAGLLLFIHGGYWRRFDPATFSHLAAGALARGWTVAMPGYPLAPEARIGRITRSVTAALVAAAAAVPGPIVVAGHSAGGHLAARLACTDVDLPGDVAARLVRVVSISGLHDLRPLLHTPINADLRLDAAEAAAESPALLAPRPGLPVHAWVGDLERPEFVRQTMLLANIWTGFGIDVGQTIEPGRHHMDVIDALADPGSALVSTLLGAAA